MSSDTILLHLPVLCSLCFELTAMPYFHPVLYFHCSPVGEGSGKAPKGVVKYTSGMSQLQESAGVATSEIGRAKMVGRNLAVYGYYRV